MTEMTLPLWASVPAALLLIVGGLLAVIGSSGLLRMRDFYSRMHPPTLGTTLGTGCVLLSSVLVTSALLHRPAVHELVLAIFLSVTSPVSAMTLMRAAQSRTRERARGAGAAEPTSHNEPLRDTLPSRPPPGELK